MSNLRCRSRCVSPSESGTLLVNNSFVVVSVVVRLLFVAWEVSLKIETLVWCSRPSLQIFRITPNGSLTTSCSIVAFSSRSFCAWLDVNICEQFRLPLTEVGLISRTNVSFTSWTVNTSTSATIAETYTCIHRGDRVWLSHFLHY